MILFIKINLFEWNDTFLKRQKNFSPNSAGSDQLFCLGFFTRKIINLAMEEVFFLHLLILQIEWQYKKYTTRINSFEDLWFLLLFVYAGTEFVILYTTKNVGDLLQIFKVNKTPIIINSWQLQANPLFRSKKWLRLQQFQGIKNR